MPPKENAGSSIFRKRPSTTFMFGVFFLGGQKLNRFQPYCLLFFGVSQQTHVTWEETAEST